MKDLRNLSRLFTLLLAGAGVAACDPGDSTDPDPVDPACPRWYLDNDGDLFGDVHDEGEQLCADPEDGRVANSADCDDHKTWVNPDQDEVCDGVDNDCDDHLEVDCPASCVPFTLELDGNGVERDYLLCPVPTRWADARTTCEAQGYQLARIDSYAENAALRTILVSDGVNQAFIGATDAAEEGAWVWIDDGDALWNGTWQGLNLDEVPGTGMPVEDVFQSWLPNQEPTNDTTVNPEGEDCAAVTSLASWVSLPCNIATSFLCERVDPQP